MVSIIPTDDHRQALRVRRFLIALAGYLLLMFVLVFVYAAGYTRGLGPLGFSGILLGHLLVNFIIFLLFHKGINLKFAILQILVGILFCSILSYYSPDAMRGVILMVYILIFMFGTFRLKLAEFFALVGVTVTLYGGSMGLLNHFHPEAVVPRLEVMRTFALLMALSWVSIMGNYIANLRIRIKRMASHDDLTNVYNRREAFEILAREKAFSDRSGISFSVCMIDLDNFKQINDTYGHLAGDTVLRAVAGAFKENIRSEDYVARYGGEEFVVVFVNFECRNGNENCVQRLLAVTEALRFPEISKALRVTASLGVTAYRPMESIDALISRADKALYDAKAKGKNRVEYLMCSGPADSGDEEV